MANTALRTKLRKDKKLAENTDLEAAITKELSHLVTPAAPGLNLAKVQGRLLSHKVLASEVHRVVEDIRTTAFPELRKPAAEGGNEDDSESESGEEESAPPAKKAKLQLHSDDEESDGASSLNGRLALSDEEAEDDGWESGSIDVSPGVAGSEDEESRGDETSDEDRNDSDGDTDKDKGEDEDEDENEGKAKAKRPSKTATSRAPPSKTAAKPIESTFLPSLSVGFTRGDSDASDLDDDEAARADGGSRKNRRGQRARRA